MAAGVAEAEGGRVVSGQAAAVVAAVMGVFVAGALWSRRWAVREHARDEAARQAPPAPAPVVETEPGVDLSVQDELDRWWALPAHRKTTTPEGD